LPFLLPVYYSRVSKADGEGKKVMEDKEQKKRQGWILAFVILMISAGVLMMLMGIMREWKSDNDEYDSRLMENVSAVDQNLSVELQDFKQEIRFFACTRESKAAEREYESNGDITPVLEYIRASSFMVKEPVAGVLMVKGEEIVACSICGKSCRYTFSRTQKQDVFLAEDEDGQCTLAIGCQDEGDAYAYIVLLNLDRMYSRLVNPKIVKDCSLILYDRDNNLFLQSIRGRPYVVRADETKAVEKSRALAAVIELDRSEQASVLSYGGSGKGIISGYNANQYRMAAVPCEQSLNQYFTIAVAMDFGSSSHEMVKSLLLISLGLAFACSGVLVLYLTINSYRRRLQEAADSIRMMQLEQDARQLNEQLLIARMKNSTSQMQPHFLYNALGSIREIVLTNPRYAFDLIYDFTTHLRACIRYMSSDSLIPFSQELENIRAYVNIEKMRMGDKLQIEYEIEADDFEIVPLSIQPFVENAIRHGIFKRGRKGGQVTVKTERTGEGILISVRDTGVGFDYAAMRAEIAAGTRDSTGMENNVFRLETMMQARVTINSTVGEGTEILILLPQERKEEK